MREGVRPIWINAADFLKALPTALPDTTLKLIGVGPERRRRYMGTAERNWRVTAMFSSIHNGVSGECTTNGVYGTTSKPWLGPAEKFWVNSFVARHSAFAPLTFFLRHGFKTRDESTKTISLGKPQITVQ